MSFFAQNVRVYSHAFITRLYGEKETLHHLLKSEEKLIGKFRIEFLQLPYFMFISSRTV